MSDLFSFMALSSRACKITISSFKPSILTTQQVLLWLDTSFSMIRDEPRSVFASKLRSLLTVFSASFSFKSISFICFTKFPALTPSKIIAPLFECHVISSSSQVKHHLPPLSDRQTALSAVFSSIIVDTNVFKSYRIPLHVNLSFF